jgi:RHS repeat-associated protein
VSYTFDNADRLTQLTRGSLTVSVAYDAAGRRSSLTLPNGLTVHYAYDNADQLTGLTYKQGGSTLGDLTYGYDGAGRRSAVGGSYARTAPPAALASASYDANNRLTAWGGATLAYDDNGNLTGDGTNSYTWDVRNRLAGVSGGVSAGFAYDALGRRSSRTVSGTTVKYLHDGLNVVQRQDASGTPTAQMLMGGLDEIFGEVTGSGTTSYFTDALGSTVALTDGSGATSAEFTYEPYGKNTKTGAGDTPFRYTGRDDDGTGLYYYRARYYHPQLGRFVAEDPIGLAGGTNLYAYANNNPVLYVDPNGESWVTAAGIIAAIAIAYAGWEFYEAAKKIDEATDQSYGAAPDLLRDPWRSDANPVQDAQRKVPEAAKEAVKKGIELEKEIFDKIKKPKPRKPPYERIPVTQAAMRCPPGTCCPQ